MKGLLSCLRVSNDDNVFSLLSSFRLRHRGLLRLSALVLAAYFILLAGGRVLSAYSAIPAQEIDCRNGYAIRLGSDDGHPGRYVLCEEYDHYQELVETGLKAEAKELTHDWRSN